MSASATTVPASRRTALFHTTVRAVVPVVLALVVGGLIILALGQNPLAFYWRTVQYGLLGDNWMRSLTLLAPLLLIAIGLIVVFRGRLWNLGYDGQFLLGAVVASGFGPPLLQALPFWLGTMLLLAGSIVVGAIWTLVPALLKARYGTNEIITSLVMSFIGVGIASLLVKGPFKDPATPQPQTEVINSAHLLPYLPGTRIHIGFMIAIVLAFAFQVLLTRTSFGLRLDVYGSGAKAASHVGIHSGRMVIVLFALSGGLIGLAAAVDILGQWTYQRAAWNPSYGDAVLPFVFLARLNPIAAIPLLAFYAVFATGGTLAAQQSGVSVDFLMVIIALILVFMTLTEYIGTRRSLGQSYIPRGLHDAVVKPLTAITGRMLQTSENTPSTKGKES